MLVKDLKPGKLIHLEEGLSCYMQESRSSKIPRLRVVKSIVVEVFKFNKCQTNHMIYLGESSEFIKKKYKNKYSKQRLVMIDGRMAYVEGKEFKYLNPISS